MGARIAEIVAEAGYCIVSGLAAGCLVSEYPPDTRPEERFFGERDRLQSGLSLGVIVIETDVESGTLITVDHARRQGRPVACLNTHPPEYRELPSFRGSRELLAAGDVYALDELADVTRFLRELKE